MKLLINIFKAILILSLTIVIIGITAIKILSSTILDEAYVFRKLRSSNYYYSIYKELKSNFENYIGPSGLEDSILDNICTVEDIQNDTEIILGNIYEGTDKKVNTDAIKERLKNKIEASLNEIKIVENNQESINQFTEQISNEYINTISHTDYEKKIYNSYQQITKIIKIGKKALGIITIIIIILLILLNIKTLNRAIANFGISFTSSGIFILTGYYMLKYNIKVEHLRALNSSISTVLQHIVTDIFNKINYYGIVLIVVGIILIILGNVLKKKQ